MDENQSDEREPGQMSDLDVDAQHDSLWGCGNAPMIMIMHPDSSDCSDSTDTHNIMQFTLVSEPKLPKKLVPIIMDPAD